MEAELIDHMGSDLTVVNAARVSFDKESDWEEGVCDCKPGCTVGIDVLSEQDSRLISYLSKHNHFTPFTHCTITMRETVPIFVARQRFKHTVGFSYNEVSRRYVDDKPEFFHPIGWRKRAENIKQGSSEELIEATEAMSEAYSDFIKTCEDIYEKIIDARVAPEQARMVLPQSMYTSYYVTGSLYAWARAYNLRSDSHAQKEIQMLSEQWNGIIQPLFPVSWKSLTGE